MITKGIEEFIFDNNEYLERESKRKNFIERFPKEKIKDLKLEEYIGYGDKSTFCYLLEFGGMSFGIRGGNANKFGIYSNAEKEYLKKNKKINGEDLAKEFDIIKNYIIEALNFVKKNEISNIDLSISPLWNIVLLKILFIYYPEKFFPIGSEVVLKCIFDELNVKGIEFSKKITY